MRVYHRVTGGVGDVLSEQFIPISEGKPNDRGVYLARMVRDWHAGKIESCGIVYESGRPIEAVLDMFADMGLRTLDADHLDGWTDSAEIIDPAEPPNLLRIPTKPPVHPVPRNFILLNTSAGDYDRLIYDESVYRTIKDVYRSTPIITVGIGECRVPTDIDLTNISSLSEVAWLAERARFVVSAVTFHRCWTTLFGTPVIELMPSDAEPVAWERTRREYEIGRYGMNQLNRIYSWPDQKGDFTAYLATMPGR